MNEPQGVSGKQETMKSACLIDLGKDERHGYILGARMMKGTAGYSEHLDVGYNRQSFGWRDNAPHLHSNSDEFFIVLKGGIDFLIRNCMVSVESGHLLGIRAGVPHQIIKVRSPVENFLVRVPGGGEDKVILPEGSVGKETCSVQTSNGLINLDLHQDFKEYPLGACLPPNHTNYSPFLDFTCVWGVDPFQAWKNEDLHFHTIREEYYFVLNGRLDFEINGSIQSVSANQILGVRPQAPHRVAGGCGPVDVLFVRVPGGRGDKTVLQPSCTAIK